MNWQLLQNSLLMSALATAGAVAGGFIASLWLARFEPARGGWRCWDQAPWCSRCRRSWLPTPGCITPGSREPGKAGSQDRLFAGRRGVGSRADALANHVCWRFGAPGSAWSPPIWRATPPCTGWPLLRVLLSPLARAALGQAAVITFVLALANFSVPAILQVKVLPAEMWIRFNTAFDTRGALLMSLPLLIAPLLPDPVVLEAARLLAAHCRPRQPFVLPRAIGRRLGSAGSGATCLVLLALSAGLPLFQAALQRRYLEGAAGRPRRRQGRAGRFHSGGRPCRLPGIGSHLPALPVVPRISRWRSVLGTGSVAVVLHSGRADWHGADRRP